MKKIPEGVFERLPVYLNCLLQLQDEGVETVSSNRLGLWTGVNPAAIRRDLIHFGNFGIKGVGYTVRSMVEEIQKILGSDQPHKIVLVGAGNLGSAIAHHSGLRNHGFHITAIFDSDADKVGTKLADVEIIDINRASEVIRRESIDFAIIAVPPVYAQSVVDAVVEAGVSVVLNYTSMLVRAPEGVKVYNTDPVKELLVTLHNLSVRDNLVPT